jgi:ankyrin repeat protein
MLRQTSNDTRDHNGMTPLMLAVDSGHEDTARRLLQQGADPNATDKWGQTALMLAAGRNDVACTRLLVEAGARLNIQARNGLTALGYALENGQSGAASVLKRARAL